MWFKVKGNAKRTHPHEKPQEGQTGSPCPAVSSLCWQTNYKTTQNFQALHFPQSIQWRADNHAPLFFPFFSFIVLVLHNDPHPGPKIHRPSTSLLLNTHLAPTNTMVRNTVAMNHAESSYNKELWNGSKYNALTQSPQLGNTAVEINEADQNILKWAKWNAKQWMVSYRRWRT